MYIVLKKYINKINYIFDYNMHPFRQHYIISPKINKQIP